jgi:hypothetical protein
MKGAAGSLLRLDGTTGGRGADRDGRQKQTMSA